MTSLRDVFMLKVNQDEEGKGCWFWTGLLDSGGYGRFRLFERDLVAHRVAYELFTGPIPEGLEIDHLCNQRVCVNPEHLEAVTRQVNMDRRWSRTPNDSCCDSGHDLLAEGATFRLDGMTVCLKCYRLRRPHLARVG